VIALFSSSWSDKIQARHDLGQREETWPVRFVPPARRTLGLDLRVGAYHTGGRPNETRAFGWPCLGRRSWARKRWWCLPQIASPSRSILPEGSTGPSPLGRVTLFCSQTTSLLSLSLLARNLVSGRFQILFFAQRAEDREAG
jgi:hypothetical protein